MTEQIQVSNAVEFVTDYTQELEEITKQLKRIADALELFNERSV